MLSRLAELGNAVHAGSAKTTIDHKEGSAGTHISDSSTTAAKIRVQTLDTQKKAAITALQQQDCSQWSA